MRRLSKVAISNQIDATGHKQWPQHRRT